MSVTSRIIVEGFVNKQIFPRTKVKSGDFAIFTFSPESVIGEIDNRTKNPKYKTDDITFKGRVPELDGGTRYKITADLKQDAKYGWQYDIVSINSVVKLDTEADVRKFLGYVFTENQINALYEAYPNPVEVLERGDVEALCKIKGIKEAKATKLLNKYNASKDSSKAYMTLSEFGLSKATIDRLVEHYGSADILAEKVKNNPYALIGEGVRIGWSKADSMALRKGIPTNSQFRINAYALYYLRNLAEVDGHTWVPLEALGSGIKGLSKDISTEMVKRELRRMVENKTLFYDKETKRIGLMKYRKLEEMICRELLRLQEAECRKMEFVEETIAECEETVGFQYTEEQKDAIRNLVNKNVILMTALAGSGKTTLMYPVSRIFRKNGLEFGICALSGKASLNLREITKEDGMTIHRLLGWNPKFGGPTFTKKNPLKTDVVILDEVSMVGGELFYSLISAIPDGGRLIMLGDPGQLESIGLCNLISDIQNSGKITNVKLTKIFRQAQRSGIITDSHKVYNQIPIIPPKFHGEEIHGELKDLKVIAKYSSEECLEAIKKEFRRLRFDENIPIEDILILSAKRSMGDLSGRSINHEIQSMIKFEDENPLKITYSDGIKYDVLYHVGDRVIVMKNNYEVKTSDGGSTEIFNGNIGTIIAKDNFHRQLTVRLAQGDVIIEGDMLLELQLGYAITCHKCISGETMIYTSDGYKSMKQFAKENGYEQVGDYEYTGNVSVWTGESWEKPDCFYNVGKNSGYKILTEGNRSIAVTSDHKFLAKKNGDMQEKWYEAEDLCVGDYIKMTKEIPDFQSEYVHIPETFYNYKSDVRSVKYNLPKVIDEKFGLFLGMMVADGTVFKTGHGARFGKKQKEVVEKFVELVNYLFGYSCKIDYWDWANMYSAEIRSTYICGFLSQFDELLPNQKNIPKAIKISPKSVQRAFMQGLMEDGAVHIKSGHFDMIEFYSCEKSIRDDLYFMLIQNGIHSSLFTRRARGYCLYIYGEMAIEFKNKIGFIGKEKNKRLELISEKRCSKPYRTKDDYFVKIKSIEPTEVDAYCFKMPKEPQFVQNGFVGSNCQGSGIPYVIVACDPGAYQLLTKQWLYTALSRAKKYCVLVGTDKSINQCVKTDRVTKKSTWLAELLMFPERICCIRTTDTTQDENIKMDMEE